MTTARSQARLGRAPGRIAGKLLLAVAVGSVLGVSASAQDGPRHWLHAGAMPPGAIGRQRMLRGGPLSGYCQPVEVRVPQGARVAPAAGSGFAEGEADVTLVGLHLAQVYRFRVTDIPGAPGEEVFPTIEMVDRLHPPPGLRLKFPVPVELTREELVMATEGKFITRVVYVEDPEIAPPVDEPTDGGQRWLDTRPGEDPLLTADHLGRPIAIVRLGGRVPDLQGMDPNFAYGGPEPTVFDRSLVPKKGAAGDPAVERLPVPEELPLSQ